MRVLHVIPALSRSGGGPARSSQGLVAALCQAGVDAAIYAFDNSDPWLPGVRALKGAWFPALLAGFDLVHIHGLWSPSLHRVAADCRRANIPYVLAPRGMLEPWSLQQKWLKKRLARFLYQDRDLKLAAALHATAESEAAQFRALGFANPIVISPNGVNLPANSPSPLRSSSPRTALFVSRMHPKKGVLELVEAWAKVRPANWVCELVYTLNDDVERAYEARVRARVHELGLDDCVVFTGSLDDDRKWSAYARASLFVLPTYSENFGIVVAEALWAGVPVITTKGTPWQDLQDHHCGWWIDLPPGDSLVAALREAAASPALAAMGEAGHRLVEAKYTWSATVKPVVEGYGKILHES